MKNRKINKPRKIIDQINLSKWTYLWSFLLLLVSMSSVAKSPAYQEMGALEENYSIKGRVSSEDGPLVGAVVYLKGTEIATTTDEKGSFEFPEKLKKGDILVFTFIGYETQEYLIEKEPSEPLTILMKVSDIVVTGALPESKRSGFLKLLGKVKAIF